MKEAKPCKHCGHLPMKIVLNLKYNHHEEESIHLECRREECLKKRAELAKEERLSKAIERWNEHQ